MRNACAADDRIERCHCLYKVHSLKSIQKTQNTILIAHFLLGRDLREGPFLLRREPPRVGRCLCWLQPRLLLLQEEPNRGQGHEASRAEGRDGPVSEE